MSKNIEKLHNWKSWAAKVKELSGGLPVMFVDQYEQSSRYSYLIGQEVHSYNTFDYRETQHDFWSLEDSLQGKDVFAITAFYKNSADKTDTTEDGIRIQYYVIRNFRSFRKVAIAMQKEITIEKAEDSVLLSVILKNNYGYTVNFSDAGNRKIFLNAHFLDGMQPKLTQQLDTLTTLLSAGSSASKNVFIKMPKEPGIYDLRFSIQVEGIAPPINSKKFKVRVIK
jgi:hypothetical protein